MRAKMWITCGYSKIPVFFNNTPPKQVIWSRPFGCECKTPTSQTPHIKLPSFCKTSGILEFWNRVVLILLLLLYIHIYVLYIYMVFHTPLKPYSYKAPFFVIPKFIPNSNTTLQITKKLPTSSQSCSNRVTTK